MDDHKPLAQNFLPTKGIISV